MPEEFKVSGKGLSYFYKDAEGEVRFECELHSVQPTTGTLILYKTPFFSDGFHRPEEWVSRAYARVKAFIESNSGRVIEVD